MIEVNYAAKACGGFDWGVSVAKTIDDTLRDVVDGLTARRTVYVIEDMHALAKMIGPASMTLTVIFSQKARPKPTYLHFLSFRLENGEIGRFDSRDDARRREEVLEKNGSLKFVRPNVTLYCDNTVEKLSDEWSSQLERFAEILSLFYAIGDAFQHIHQGAVEASACDDFVKNYPDRRLSDVCRFIAKRFKVTIFYAQQPDDEQPYQTFFLRSEMNSSRSETDGGQATERAYGTVVANLLENKPFTEALAKAVSKGQNLPGCVTAGDGQIYFKILPIKTYSYPSGKNIGTSGAFVVLQIGQQIRTKPIFALESIISAIQRTKYSVDRSATISNLQDKLIRYTIESARSHLNHTERKAALKAFAKKCVEAVCRCSEAHSATIRLYNPFSRTLDRIEFWNTKDGAYSRGHNERAEGRENIPIGEYRSYVNAFCFRTRKPSEIVLIQDLSRIPEEYKSLGLRRAEVFRDSSFSEFCLPIYAGEVAIGTFNMEAPCPFSLESDIPFFTTIRDIFSQYHRIVASTGDSEVLSMMSFRHIATHRLENFQATLTPAQLAAFLPLVKAVNQGDPSTDISANEGILHRARQKALSLPDGEDVIKIIKSNGEDVVPISESFGHSIDIILGDIIGNARKHSDWEKDILLIDFKPEDHSSRVQGASPTINIHYTSARRKKKRDVEKYGTQPLLKAGRDDLNPRHSFGMLLISIHTRLLGGVVEFNIPEAVGPDHSIPVDFVLRIPCPPGNEGREEDA